MYYPKERNMIIFDVDGPKDSQAELTDPEFTTNSQETKRQIDFFEF